MTVALPGYGKAKLAVGSLASGCGCSAQRGLTRAVESVTDRQELGTDYHHFQFSDMSFAQKPSPGRLLLDDTVPLTAVIETSQNLQSHTVSVFFSFSFASFRYHYYFDQR